jgi:GLPGLI family protein
MKRYVIIAFLCVLKMGAFAQKTEGVVYYDEKVNMHRRIEDENMKAMIPEWRVSKSQLFFKDDVCVYKPIEEDDEEQETGGGGMRIRMMRPYFENYRNLATDQSVEQRDFQGKKYLIEDSIKVTPWKLGTDTKKILGYDCMKATYNDTTRKQDITAWFTNDISLAAGPTNMGSLPGLILEVNINNGELIWTATKVDFIKVKPDDLKAPTKGEKITRAEYQKKMEEFRKQMGGRGARIIRN